MKEVAVKFSIADDECLPVHVHKATSSQIPRVARQGNVGLATPLSLSRQDGQAACSVRSPPVRRTLPPDSAAAG